MLAVADDLLVLTVATAVFSKQMELLGLSKTDVCESVEANVVVTAVVDLDLTSVEVGGLLVEGGGLPVEGGELPVEGGVLLVLVLETCVMFMLAFPATIAGCTLCHLMFSQTIKTKPFLFNMF